MGWLSYNYRLASQQSRNVAGGECYRRQQFGSHEILDQIERGHVLCLHLGSQPYRPPLRRFQMPVNG